jgi:hypothetical protein
MKGRRDGGVERMKGWRTVLEQEKRVRTYKKCWSKHEGKRTRLERKGRSIGR